MCMNRKQQFKALFRGRPVERPLFIPFIGTYLHKVSQKSMRDIMHDPGFLHQSLRDVQQLLSLDGIITPLDETLEAEAFGCSVHWEDEQKVRLSGELSGPMPDVDAWLNRGRIPVYLEGVKRFAQVEGKELPLLATVTGPFMLAFLLYGETGMDKIEEINPYVLRLIKGYAEAGADGIIINEGGVFQKHPSFQEALVQYYKPLINVVRYYNKYVLVRLTALPDQTDLLFKLNVHGLIAPLETGSQQKKVVLGLPLDVERLSSQREADGLLPEGVDGNGAKGLFFSTDRPLNEEEGDIVTLQANIKKLWGLSA